MKHFESLQEKILEMENRHQQRERELQDVIRNARQTAADHTSAEADKWRRLLDVKNGEMERFRQELDSILEVLRELQRQGVVIPLPGALTS